MSGPDDVERVVGVVRVVGVGAEGRASLTPRALALVESAELLAGGQRLLDQFPGIAAERIRIGAQVDEALSVAVARRGTRRVVVLATGDPNYFGITRALRGHLGPDELEIVPNVSALQWAFARAGEPWDDASFVSVHGRPLGDLAPRVRGRGKVCVFTDATNTPAAIARELLAAGVNGFRAVLCEDLGGPDERVRRLALGELAGAEAHPLNTLLLLAESGDAPPPGAVPAEAVRPLGDLAGRDEGAAAPLAWGPGLPDDAFEQRTPKAGLITKREVRILALAELGLRPDSVVWDVGAGSGSVSVEAARLAPSGRVYAIEKNAEDARIAEANAARLAPGNVTVIHGRAPAALEGLPDPDAVFVGGSGGELDEILAVAARQLRPRGRVVVTAVTVDTLWAAVAACRTLGLAHRATLVTIARSKPLLGMLAFEGLNPIHIVTAWRDDTREAAEPTAREAAEPRVGEAA